MTEESVPASIDPIISESAQAENQENAPAAADVVEDKPASYSGTRHKIKIDDAEEEIEYDELIKGYQKGKAGDKRLREAAQLRQQVESFLTNLKSGDHKNLVKILGKDVAKGMAEKLLLEEIEYEELPEHEKTIRQLQKEKEELQREREDLQKTEKSQKQRALEIEAGKKIEADLVDAVTKAGMKPTERLFGRMAEYMEAYHLQTKEMLPAKEALEHVREDLTRDFTAHIESSSDEQLGTLIKSLPKKFLDAVRADAVSSVLSQTSVTKRTDNDETPTPKRSREADRRMSTDDWFSKMEKRLGS